MATTNATIQIKRDTRANWAGNNPTLANGQLGWDTTNDRVYVGNGSTSFTTMESASDYFNKNNSDQLELLVDGDQLKLSRANGTDTATFTVNSSGNLTVAVTGAEATIAGIPLVDATGAADFETKNLIVNFASSTTATVTADRMSFLNSANTPTWGNSINQIFDITTDLIAGTSEKASHWYQLWLGSAGTRLMVPDLTGTADSTTAGSLEDSGADWVTDDVSIGDIVRNRTDNTETAVSAVTDLNTLALEDDIFISGEDYEIRMLSPTGADPSSSRVGKAYNNVSSNLDKVLKNGRARITQSRWHTVNGQGSSSTRIQKFTTEVDVSDDVVATISNSAVLGFTVIMNMNCKLYATYVASTNAPDSQFGFSLNSTQLTTSLTSITAADRLCIAHDGPSNTYNAASWSGQLSKGDVFRPHKASDADGSSPQFGSITIMAVEII